jgi:hypothetical protein
MRLLRQPAPGDWLGLLDRVAADLAQRTVAPTAGHGAHLPRRRGEVGTIR